MNRGKQLKHKDKKTHVCIIMVVIRKLCCTAKVCSCLEHVFIFLASLIFHWIGWQKAVNRCESRILLSMWQLIYFVCWLWKFPVFVFPPQLRRLRLSLHFRWTQALNTRFHRAKRDRMRYSWVSWPVICATQTCLCVCVCVSSAWPSFHMVGSLSSAHVVGEKWARIKKICRGTTEIKRLTRRKSIRRSKTITGPQHEELCVKS